MSTSRSATRSGSNVLSDRGPRGATKSRATRPASTRSAAARMVRLNIRGLALFLRPPAPSGFRATTRARVDSDWHGPCCDILGEARRCKPGRRMTMKILTLAGPLLVVAAVALGCSDRTKQETREAGQEAAEAARATGD